MEVIGVNEMGRPDFRRVPREGEAPPPEQPRPRRGHREREKPQPRKTELKAGDLLAGTVKNTAEFGAFVELDEGGAMGLIHISELAEGYVNRVEDVVQPGDRVAVKVLRIDDRGRIYLQRVVRDDIKVS